MICGDDETLWAFAEGSLDATARAKVAQHLEHCAECREAQSKLEATRTVLRAAAGARAPVDWARADEAVMGAATLHVAKRARWRMPAWSYAMGLAVAAALLTLLPKWGQATFPAEEGASPPSVAPVLADVTVEAASGATTEAGALESGGPLRQNARIATDERGSALFRLPDQSRARLGARTEATLAKVSRDEIELHLHRGNVVVRAAHVKRKEFLVDTPEAQVRVVGTAFRVARLDGQVTVSVVEGRVLVEPRGGDSRLVDAGQRVVLGRNGAYLEASSLRSEDSAAFAELEPEQQPVQQPPEQAASDRPRARAAERADPVTARPSLSGAVASTSIPHALPVETPPASVEAPRPPATEPGIQPTEPAPRAVAAVKPGIPTTAEGLFLQRADEALRTGKCQNYLLGLQEVIEGTQDRAARETAYVLRARCFDEQLDPDAAVQEYRKYLQRFPSGRFADEARRVVSE